MKELEKTLLAKQINPTAMRLVILDYLLKQDNAVSLTDVELGLEKTDRVTLYRSIKTFEEHGLVHRIEDGTGVTKFALCQPACTVNGHHDLHVHFYCINCQETYCLPKTQIPEVKLPGGYERQETSLLVKGLCSDCKKQCTTIAGTTCLILKELIMNEYKFEGFDDQLSDLRPEVKEKALELAEVYLNNGLEAGAALKEAIAEAELWFLNSEG